MSAAHRAPKGTATCDAMDVDIESTKLMQVESHWIPNDVYLLYSKSSMYILVGLRDGHMVLVAVSIPKETQDGTRLVVLDATTAAIGQAPVSFVRLSDPAV
ncbi:hypothetical protein GGI22_007955, partial [Coemansia erecta]